MLIESLNVGMVESSILVECLVVWLNRRIVYKFRIVEWLDRRIEGMVVESLNRLIVECMLVWLNGQIV